MSTLKDKNILIAGGSSGMGFALAQKCLEEGAIVHLVSSNLSKLQTAQKELVGSRVYIYALDISDEAAVSELARAITSLDHLVTAAAQLFLSRLCSYQKTKWIKCWL